MINKGLETKFIKLITRKKSNYDGFSLLELMIIMAIFVVLAGVGVVSVTQYIPNYRKQAASRTVLSDLIKARIYAIKERKSQTVEISNNKYEIYETGNKPNKYLIRDFVADYDWKGLIIRANTNPILNPDGTINNISTIQVNCGGSDPVSITMTITGNLKIEE
jgi:type IV fimbrial biogenesis protein FimT